MYENEFNSHVNEISFSYEKMGTKTRFEEEALTLQQNSAIIQKIIQQKRLNILQVLLGNIAFIEASNPVTWLDGPLMSLLLI